ncbi:accessory Sec system translocase SecA2 [Ligilactobacillus salivarius]|uniref:Protein translocase subunit SecA n=2 Tax=Ligilactobacillus salivarius TaxID=1624 RepID=V6DNF5_9LACO|nr:accessory Sec system translocase SecA2 [Ligilactobacillus salivarius]CDK35167.1 Protein export cytoplasm protein SecA2 ATPase RNA helicase (TC 3.A.5.1.1) [Ligilactobacillus salivarius cp400]AIR09831.1 Protein export cytoplasm protein SecA2 ATPase RNA helicase [Ligilactobacillus salivarius]MCF2623689.1 accessory Sec system translocase SecA2 [Ligilactobacillus salivarius]MDH4960178.1 accessory Sec system translocase SecA2 [Ligilactobacillus salivarius]MDY5246087.1 accessory Sec system translo
MSLRVVKKILKKVNSHAEEMSKLSDNQLKDKTQQFKKRLKQGETLDNILPEAFAAIREADKRVLGMFPYDVQVMGGIVLHQGNIAEMKTGEGKTLTATMPMYLNALSGESTILVTTNEYLANRDCEEMSQVYNWMGLSAASAVPENADDLKVEEKREIYNSDIVYTTNNALGFDYLIDNLASSKEEKFMPEFSYVIVDEVDAVLLDTATTSLVISGAPRVQSNMYKMTDEFVVSLEEEEDYRLDEEKKNVWLTRKGIEVAQEYFRVPNLYDGKHVELVRHITLALKAHNLFEKGKDYVIEDNKMYLLDSTEGRILENTKMQQGQQQAIEAAEGAEISDDMRSMASITYQNFFRLFKKIGGMTGTGKTANKEFIETYYMKVIQIPTNNPVIRKDYPDKIYPTLREKLMASLKLVKELHEKGQPILLTTADVELSEIYSEILLHEQIPHNLLNAHNAAKEAEIISEAGQWGSVTVATSMAGRGTDIKLGKGVKELGGLAVIGTELMPSKRTELQLRGRSGRQGDPGFSQFFVSLEDDVVIDSGPKWVHKYFKKHRNDNPDSPRELKSLRFRWAMKRTQKQHDNQGYNNRKQTMDYDESSKKQRNLIYSQRDELISENGRFKFNAEKFILKYLDGYLAKHKADFTRNELSRLIFDNLSYTYNGVPDNFPITDKAEIKKLLHQIVKQKLREKEAKLENVEEIERFYRLSVLKAIDTGWVEEVDNLQQLRSVVESRSSAQRNPVYEYHKEASKSFERMQEYVNKLIVQNIMLSVIEIGADGKKDIYFA